MKRLIVGLAAAVVLVGVGSVARGAIIVAPGDSATVEGNGNNLVPAFAGRTIRHQQVFAASEFGLLLGPEFITSIAFRPDGLVSPGPVTVPHLQVSLSTTSAASDGLSTVFSSNIGTDDTVVFDDSWTLSSSHTGSPKDFDVVLNLQSPFLYDPSAGNLLLDMKSFSSPTGDFALDGLNIDGDSVSRVISVGTDAASGVDALGGTASSFGLIVQFTTSPVPEPSTLVTLGGLLGMGLIAHCWRRRRKA